MSNQAIGWSDCTLLSKKMGNIQMELVHYVAGRSGDDHMIQIMLGELVETIKQIQEKTKRKDPWKSGKVVFPNWKNIMDMPE